MIKPVLIAATAIPLAFAAPSFAQTRAQPPARATPGIAAPQDQALSEPEVRDVLEIEGYTDIQTFQADGDMYQMTAQRDGKPVLLRVNARTRRYSERPAN
jgi:hypothetical protein